MAAQVPVPELASQVRAGARAAVARAITLVESARQDHRHQARQLLTELAPYTGGAIRVGLSGVPGAGKSTLIDTLGARLVGRGHRVAVLAVDPSSSRSGGSILGDRTRMAHLASLDDAFVRPSPTGLQLGGVARATRESMLVLEAAGYDVVLVETVGVGQSEVAVSEMVDTFVLIALARSGDQLQGIKRGILEMADVIAVNKADGEHVGAARAAARDLSVALRLVSPEDRRAAVLTCIAHTGDGVDDLWEQVMKHRAALTQSEDRLAARRRGQLVSWLWALVEGQLLDALKGSEAVRAVSPAVEQAVSAGQITTVEGATRIVHALAQDLPALVGEGGPS